MQGNLVSLRPLTVDDAVPLWDEIGADQATWRWVGNGAEMPGSAEGLAREFAQNLTREKSEYFAVEDLATKQTIGSTAFLDIRPEDKHLEIGSTFIAPAFRGGKRNLEMKLLMLTEAFENRGCVRVTIKANAQNEVSRRAIEKIGAKFEGLLRNQRQERDGTWRTAAYYSVISDEWPETKLLLTELLANSSC